jgi:hypothetical protein
MVQLLFARLPQFKDDTTSPKRVKDLSTKNNHQRVHSETYINQQQINRQNDSIRESNLTYVRPDWGAEVQNLPVK